MERDRTPRTSVVMPVRNGARWIAEAVESIRRQDFCDWELIVVDDGSTDTTHDLVRAMADGDRRIKLLSGPAHGVVAALNAGLRIAAAGLVARLDSDDIAHPSRLRRQVETFAANPGLVLLGSWARIINDAGKVTGVRTPPTSTAEIEDILSDRNPFIHSSVMMRRSALERAGVYRVAAQNAEDYDLWLRLCEVGDVAILGEELVDYRVHALSATSKRPLLQAFAARLARISAAERRAGRPDPLENMSSEPHWSAPEMADSAFSTFARFYRFLDFEPHAQNGSKASMPPTLPDIQRLGRFSHPEKVLLRRAVLRLALAPGHRGGLSASSLVRAFIATLA